MVTSARELEIEIPDDIDTSLPIVPISKDHNNLNDIDRSVEINKFSRTVQMTTIVKETQESTFRFSDDFMLDTAIRIDAQSTNDEPHEVKRSKDIDKSPSGLQIEKKNSIVQQKLPVLTKNLDEPVDEPEQTERQDLKETLSDIDPLEVEDNVIEERKNYSILFFGIGIAVAAGAAIAFIKTRTGNQ